MSDPNPADYPNQATPPPRPGRDRRLIVLAVVAVLVAVGAIGVGALVHLRGTRVAGVAQAAETGGASAGGGSFGLNGAVRVGPAAAKVTVRLVADLQCPACKAFERDAGQVLMDAVKEGSTAVEYNIITFLDRASTDQYSSRAGNASYCVASSGTGHYQQWLESLFGKQPAEGGAGLPDATLIEIAKSAGYTDPAVAQCITDRKYDKPLRENTKQVFATGVNATPTVFVNDKQIPNRDLSASSLRAMIAAAR
ncbi:DsbA family protein [Nocardia panacis]|uniref:DsbA family protein n=1 Tax=Nocardia panacis TaxID=2340916 RepID=A0A3A4KEL0_9NOCA|nr:DsbA family protein [Nocardia panacis]RJO77141.1 DsbA family protein [Nocardia panacis]